MTRADNGEKGVRRSAGRRERGTHASTPGCKSGLATAMQTEIWHRRYPPTSVARALSRPAGPLTAAAMQTFTGPGITGLPGLEFHLGVRRARKCSPSATSPSDVVLAYCTRESNPSSRSWSLWIGPCRPTLPQAVRSTCYPSEHRADTPASPTCLVSPRPEPQSRAYGPFRGVLMKSKPGKSNSEVAAMLGIWQQTVGKWRRRFL